LTLLPLSQLDVREPVTASPPRSASPIVTTQTFAGKVTLITGGSRALGAATALAFAEQGSNVAISYVGFEEKAATVSEQLEAKGVRAIAIKSDQEVHGLPMLLFRRWWLNLPR
jgi:hypothetical protein